MLHETFLRKNGFDCWAEYLIALAIMIKYPSTRLVIRPDITMAIAGISNTALRFYDAPISLRFRALYEMWDFDQIVRELY